MMPAWIYNNGILLPILSINLIIIIKTDNSILITMANTPKMPQVRNNKTAAKVVSRKSRE